jgi:hypothetical protein
MKIIATGWSRNMGGNHIGDLDLEEAEIRSIDEGEWPPPGGVIIRYSDDQVIVTWHQQGLRLTGDYRVGVEVSKAEIEMLAELVVKKNGAKDKSPEDEREPRMTRKDLGRLLCRTPPEDLAEALRFAMFQHGWARPRIDNLNLLRRVNVLNLSTRCFNCLGNANICYIGDLVQKTEEEMLQLPNFGWRSLYEIREQLNRIGLQLGMELPGWPPEDIEQLAELAEKEFRTSVRRGLR